ncbi:hypothetical protein C8F01DRAFT_1312178 [Mycena amicta]|nr:hypothetical protein C8F01DRAFT_1312178 [Mycena amicta]
MFARIQPTGSCSSAALPRPHMATRTRRFSPMTMMISRSRGKSTSKLKQRTEVLNVYDLEALRKTYSVLKFMKEIYQAEADDHGDPSVDTALGASSFSPEPINTVTSCLGPGTSLLFSGRGRLSTSLIRPNTAGQATRGLLPEVVSDSVGDFSHAGSRHNREIFFLVKYVLWTMFPVQPSRRVCAACHACMSDGRLFAMCLFFMPTTLQHVGFLCFYKHPAKRNPPTSRCRFGRIEHGEQRNEGRMGGNAVSGWDLMLATGFDGT